LTAVAERDAANAARRMAEEQRSRADRQAEDLRRQLYASRISSIAAAIDEANFLGLRELLQTCPENLRNWEWHRLAWLLADRSVRTIAVSGEHEGAVVDVAIGADGQRLLSASPGDRLKIWSVSTGRVVQSLIEDDVGALDVQWSADGRSVLVAGRRGIQLLDTVTGRQIRRWAASDWKDAPRWIRGVALSPDGTRVLIDTGDGHVYDVQTDEPIALLPRFNRRGAFSPDGERVAFSATAPYRISVFDLSQNTLLEFPRLGSTVTTVAFSPDGRRILSGNEDKAVRIWDSSGGAALRTLIGHHDTIKAVAMDLHGQRLASGGADRTVRLWDASTGECLAVFLGHEAPVRRVAFTPDGQHVVSYADDGVVKVWETAVAPSALTLDDESESSPQTLCVSYRPDGGQIASAGSHRGVELWDPDTGRLLQVLAGHDYWVYAVAYRPPDGMMLASSDDGGYVRLWDTHSGELLRTIRPQDMGEWGQVRSLAFSPDGTRLAGASQSMECVYVWDPDTGRQLHRLEQSGWADVLAFSADGTMIAHAGKSDAVLLRDADTGELRHTLAVPARTSTLAFNPAGTRLLAGDWDGRLHFWDTSSGDRLALLDSHAGAVNSVAYGSDGQRIIAAFRDNSIRIWSVTGEELLILRGHDDTVNAVALSPDGRSIASASSDGSVRVWETGPPPSGDAARRIVREATALVGRMRREHTWTIQAIEAIESARSLDAAVRNEAVRHLVSGGREFNEESWQVARKPGQSSADYRLAVRTAELAVQLGPDTASWAHTLG
ncbi:MAG: WD40 repeat domain-containing protein, partial [Planctomycetota bacterium]